PGALIDRRILEDPPALLGARAVQGGRLGILRGGERAPDRRVTVQVRGAGRQPREGVNRGVCEGAVRSPPEHRVVAELRLEAAREEERRAPARRARRPAPLSLAE